MTDATPPFSWRSIILPAYLPTFLFSVGEGAIIPVIPVVATERGASLAIAGFIAAMLMVGELVGDLPAGWLVARIGERISMIGASMLAVIGILIALVAPSVFALGIGVLLNALRHFSLRHVKMVLVCPTERLLRPFQVTGLVGRLTIFDSREKALGAPA